MQKIVADALKRRSLGFDGFKKTSKIRITLILFVFSAQFFSYAQNNNDLDFLVLHSGDKLYGSVEHINLKGVNPRLHKKIRFTSPNGQRKQFRRKDVLAFRVDGITYESFWLSQSSRKFTLLNSKYDIDPKTGELHFLKLITKGNLSHYQMEWWEQGESTLMWMDLLKKERDPFLIRATQGIFGIKKNLLVNYFSNCFDLKTQIEQEEFKDVYQIVDFYNRNCAN
ncbi:hypothetical protein [Pararhodonellum marinum]|uniref:hypothetical protein n=1 Tax=Pararhodonellum marinum TaxID=2755358 RepID=UPI0018902FED|nr:hypothetical protein [Pararhodonellum marinum]